MVYPRDFFADPRAFPEKANAADDEPDAAMAAAASAAAFAAASASGAAAAAFAAASAAAAAAPAAAASHKDLTAQYREYVTERLKSAPGVDWSTASNAEFWTKRKARWPALAALALRWAGVLLQPMDEGVCWELTSLRMMDPPAEEDGEEAFQQFAQIAYLTANRRALAVLLREIFYIIEARKP